MASTRRNLNDLVMGDHDCPKSDVLAAIVGSTGFGNLHEEWRSVAMHLGLPDFKIRKLYQDYLLEVRVHTLPQLVDELLTIWKAEKGDYAKIVGLCDAFENCGLTDISYAVSSKFKESCPRKDEEFLWRRKLVTLEELLGKDQDSVGEIDKNISEPQGKEIIKAHLTPPAQPKYYVPRTLSYIPSYEIDSAIFLAESTKDHVFLFNDITKSELARVTGYKFPLEISGDQLHNVTVRFILLECDDDYERICNNTTSPAHMIRHQGQRYFWIKSSAALEVVRQFLKEPPRDISEEELVNRILSTPSPCAISIADSPGMGKTLVLANLAAEILERSSNNTVHLFVVLQEFIKQLTSIESSTSALEALAAYCSSDRMTEPVLTKMLQKFFQVYLFLDGYDEVLHDKSNVVDTFLQNVQELKNFKVIITTRPHVKTRLELIFYEFSYGIHPFIEEDQSDFLARYWVDKHGAEPGKVLEEFARQCVSALHHNMSDEEKEIAGIPLQCMMLGEVYAGEGKRASRLKHLHPNSVKPITFIHMYKRLINLKLSRIPEGSCRQKYLKAHYHEAIMLLFPDWIEKFKPILGGFDDIDEMTMYSIGLFEHSPSATPRFVHRTFAEYLLAEFIVDNLDSHYQSVEFLFGEILGRKGCFEVAENLQTINGFKTYKLKHPVIGYFIEMHLKQRSTDELLLSDYPKFGNFHMEDICMAVQVSCSHDLEKSYDFTSKLLLNLGVEENLRDKYFQDLLHVTIWRCMDTRMLMKVMKLTNQLFGVDVSYHSKRVHSMIDGRNYIYYDTPLHFAVCEGKYNVVAWLVQELGDKNEEYLLHACVRVSEENSNSTIENKKLIIDMLQSTNQRRILERDKNDCTPLLQQNIHPDLLVHLVHHGADINESSSKKGTVLHQLRFRVDCMELFRRVFLSGFKLGNFKDLDGRTPIMHAIMNLGSVDDETLGMFLKAGTELVAEDEHGNSVLFYALKYSGNVEFVKGLIKRGAELRHKNKKNQNVLHWAMQAEKGSTADMLAITDMLIGINRDWINDRDEDGRTPMLVHCHLKLGFSIDLGLLPRLVEHGADINAYSCKYGTVLHSIDLHTDVYADLVRFAFLNGFNLVNHVDEHNRTPLMKAIMHLGTMENEILQLFLEAGADVNAENQRGDSVLFYAIQFSGNLEFIKKLIESGAKVQHKNKLNQNVLHKIMQGGNNTTKDRLASLDILVEINQNWVNESDLYGCTPLLVQYDIYRVVRDLRQFQRLVEHGADINAYSSEFGTVLHLRHRDRDTYMNFVRWAFKSGFNLVNNTNKSNQTPLMYAMHWWSTIDDDVLQLFHQAGAVLNSTNK